MWSSRLKKSEKFAGGGRFFPSDAAQALGKIPIDVEEMKIDLMSASGHKSTACKGIGFFIYFFFFFFFFFLFFFNFLDISKISFFFLFFWNFLFIFYFFILFFILFSIFSFCLSFFLFSFYFLILVKIFLFLYFFILILLFKNLLINLMKKKKKGLYVRRNRGWGCR